MKTAYLKHVVQCPRAHSWVKLADVCSWCWYCSLWIYVPCI